MTLQPDQVREMFDRISPAYDRMNRVMSAGMDGAWRSRAVRCAGLAPGGSAIDVCCGTGDMAPVFYDLAGVDVEQVPGVPTELNRRLVAGEIDVAPISSIEYARNADKLRLLPELCVSTEGAVDSIQLITRRPLEQVRTVAVTPESATSVVLTKVLLGDVELVPLDHPADARMRVLLPHVQGWNEARRAAAARYAELGLGELVELPREARCTTHVYHLFVVRAAERDVLASRLRDAGVGAVPYYATPLHLQPVFRSLGYRPGDLPHTERAARESLALPMFPTLDEASQSEVVAAVRAAAPAAA